MKKTSNQLYHCDVCDNEEVKLDDLVLLRNKKGESIPVFRCNPEKGDEKVSLDTMLICKDCLAKNKPKGWVRKRISFKTRV